MSGSLDKSAHPDISMRSLSSNGINIDNDKKSFENDETPLIDANSKPSRFNLKLWKAPIISGFISMKIILGETYKKALYVLFLLTIVFMLAQIAMWLLGVTSSNMQSDQGWGPGDGTGEEYDFLAGPLFAIMSIISTLPVGYVVDRGLISREKFLCLGLIIWSLSTIFTGYSQHYYQIVLCRMISAMSTAIAQPLCASIVSDWYPSKVRASAMAIFNFGIYIGFSIAYGIGNWVSADYVWRVAWYIFGFLGLFVAIFIFFLPKYTSIVNKPKTYRFPEIKDVDSMHKKLYNQKRKKHKKHYNLPSEADLDNFSSTDLNDDMDAFGESGGSSYTSDDSNLQQIVTIGQVIAYYVASPSLILLLFASFYRNCGGYIWGYSANNYFLNEKDQTENQIASYLGWIPAVAGSIGCLFGGALSDRLASKYGKGANDTQFIESTVVLRLWILVIASLISGPLAAGTIILDPPYGYYSLFLMYLFSEMWIAITVTIVADLSPPHMKSTLLSVYYFVIAFGGFAPQLVTPFQNLTGSYFWSIFILWPCVYTSVSILFFAVIFTYKRDLTRQRRFQTQ